MIMSRSLFNIVSLDAPVSRAFAHDILDRVALFTPEIWLAIVEERTSGEFSDQYYRGLLSGYYRAADLHGETKSCEQYSDVLTAIERRIIEVLQPEVCEPKLEAPRQYLTRPEQYMSLLNLDPQTVLLSCRSFDSRLDGEAIEELSDRNVPIDIMRLVQDRIHGIYSSEYYRGLLAGYWHAGKLHDFSENCAQFIHALHPVHVFLARYLEARRNRSWFRRVLKWLI